MNELAGELLTLSIMAFALGMDAFSVGLGMGMIQLRFRQIIYIGLVIGIFHMFMPLFGMLTGQLLSGWLGLLATYIGGALLLVLGLQMIVASIRKEDKPFIAPVGTGLVLFATSVSLDSFSVGLSLGIYGSQVWMTILLFGFFSMLLTWLGLLLGKQVRSWVGSYSGVLGGIILLAFGIKLLFPL
ncbi:MULTISPECIES: manganese efflux pump MntP [Bacillus]|uniref:manganese efflux pump MntP n=1 Tax=Bacillus TaxID=1386 RepID=UPI0021B3D1F7|nr:manganese efflux pump MntP family protein [Bacillus safensis]UXC32159.1 manganese efflux pump MntP family protein [Bacillus safensis]